MNKHLITAVMLVFTCLVLSHSSLAQEESTQEISYQVHKSYPSLSITTSELAEAKTLLDLNAFYKPEWIKQYIKVEISVTCNGSSQRAISKTDQLSPEQKEIMHCADAGSDIRVIVDYIPENNLSHNEAQQVDFKFYVEPEVDAQYIGGQAALLQYIESEAISSIPSNTFEDYDVAAVKFSIMENGHIANAEIFETSQSETIDALLLDVICNMSPWVPAIYADGSAAPQDYVLTVGNMENCIVTLLNIRENN